MEKLILSEDEIVKVSARLADEIDTALVQEKDVGIPIFLGIMNGALPFMYELVRHIKTPCLLDTLKCSSYNGTQSTGKITVQKEPDHNLEGKTVVIVEDIIDTGLTMHFLKQFILDTYHPKKLLVCVLIKRNQKHLKYDELADFTGLTTEEQNYIVGFGFDYYGLYRNVPYVFVPSVKDVKEWSELFEDDKKLTADYLAKNPKAEEKK
ncbi:MAG: phosphoribosyltransferase family protein, partial [Bacilli bacterium]|jgi:hypoxanthine phosphoribosyltransferase